MIECIKGNANQIKGNVKLNMFHKCSSKVIMHDINHIIFKYCSFSLKFIEKMAFDQ